MGGYFDVEAMGAALGEYAGRFEVGKTGIDCVEELFDAGSGCCGGKQDRRRLGVGLGAEIEHLFEVGFGGGRVGTVGFVDDKNVGDFKQASFVGLDAVAHAWGEDDDRQVGGCGDADLGLAGTDGFDDYWVEAAVVEDAGGSGDG